MGNNLVPIPGFCGSSYLSRAKGVSAARTVNMRVEKNQDPTGTVTAPIPVSKSPYTMYPRSGKKLFTTLPTSPGFGAWANKSQVFIQSGGHVYEVLQDKTFTDIGEVTVGSNPATMRSNGNQLLICSGGDVFLATGLAFYQPIINFARGSVSIAGNVVTWLSDDQGGTGFLPGGAGDVEVGNLFMAMFPLGPKLATVVAVADNTHLTLDIAPGDSAGIDYQVGTELLTGAMCEFIDGYFIVNIPNSKNFRISNPLDGSKWDDLDIASKSGSTDNIGAIRALSGNLVLLGDTNSTEIWGDSGNADFPFARINGQTLAMGADAPWSVVNVWDGSLVGLATSDSGNGVIIMCSSGAPVRISDHAIENAIRKYKRTDDAIGSAYLEGGHAFYRIDFPTANKSWEYDLTSSVWVEIGVETPQDEVYGCDAGRYHVHVTWPNEVAVGGNQMHLVMDFASGKLYQTDPEFLDDDGVDIPIMRISPHVNSYLKWQDCEEFALDCELGTIDPAIKGADGKPLIPTVQMSYSDDGGNTWTDPVAASLGRYGEYQGTYFGPGEITDATPNSQTNPRTYEPMPSWKNLGKFRIARTFKVKSSAKMLRSIYNGLIDLGNPA